MIRATAHVATRQASRYLQQLAKHWSHKLEVEFTPQQALIRFPAAVTRMAAGTDALTVTIEAEDGETVERYKGVVAAHLDRFAFREAPLGFEWSETAAADGSY
jgi:hypothetical protein